MFIIMCSKFSLCTTSHKVGTNMRLNKANYEDSQVMGFHIKQMNANSTRDDAASSIHPRAGGK